MTLTLFIFGAILAAAGGLNIMFSSGTAKHVAAWTAAVAGCAVMALAIALPRLIA